MIHCHGGNVWEAHQKYKIPPEEIIDFSANINPMKIPPEVKKILKERLNVISYYPDPECKELKNKLSKSLNIPYRNLIVGNGSNELIFLYTRTLNPKRGLIPIPTYSEYERALKNIKARIKFVQLREDKDFKIDPKEIIDRLRGIEVLFLCNPNNPTGYLTPKEELLQLLEVTERKRVFLILDETFIDLKEEESLIREVPKREYLFILRSFSKFFGIPGLRLGYGVGSKKFIKRLEKIREPWTVNIFAQLAGSQILNEFNYIKRSRSYIEKEKRLFFEELLKINGIKPYPSSANFILVKIEAPVTSTRIQEELIKHRIMVRDCSNFRGFKGSFIRMAVRTRKENLSLIKALKEILREFGQN